jgi:hypothetical protein
MERIEVRMEGGISTKRIARIYGETLKGKNGKPRYFRSEDAAIKAAEKAIKARRQHIGE